MAHKYYGPRMTIDKLSDEGCLNFLKQFLVTLSREFTHTLASLIKDPHNEDIRAHYNYLTEFFNSEYFYDLTTLDGRSIVKQLESRYVKSLNAGT